MLQYGCVGKPLQVTGRHIGIALVSCPHHSLQAFQHGEGFYMVHSLPQNPGLPYTNNARINQGIRCLGRQSSFCNVANDGNKLSVAIAALVVLHGYSASVYAKAGRARMHAVIQQCPGSSQGRPHDDGFLCALSWCVSAGCAQLRSTSCWITTEWLPCTNCMTGLLHFVSRLASTRAK